MKRLIQTKFFCTLQEASQKGIEADAGVLKTGYDEFAMHLFSQCAAPPDRAAHYNTLVYTRAELAGLTEVSGEKYGVCQKSYPAARQPDRFYGKMYIGRTDGYCTRFQAQGRKTFHFHS